MFPQKKNHASINAIMIIIIGAGSESTNVKNNEKKENEISLHVVLKRQVGEKVKLHIIV